MDNSLNRWDARWREKAGNLDWEVDPWLKRIFPLLTAFGRALDLACGVGQNSIFLAEHHYNVTAVDLSREALNLLDREAASRSLSIQSVQVDLESEPVLPNGPFDLVLDFFYLHRPLIASLWDLLRPGGLMVIRTFSYAGSFSPPELDSRFVLEPGELLKLFDHWEILLHEEGIEPSTKGGSLAGIIARKPYRKPS